MTDLEREVAEERAAQGLPPRVRDPVVLQRVARLVHAPIPTSTSSAELVVVPEHPRPRNDSAPDAALPGPGATSEQGDAHDKAYATTKTP